MLLLVDEDEEVKIIKLEVCTLLVERIEVLVELGFGVRLLLIRIDEAVDTVGL